MMMLNTGPIRNRADFDDRLQTLVWALLDLEDELDVASVEGVEAPWHQKALEQVQQARRVLDAAPSVNFDLQPRLL